MDFFEYKSGQLFAENKAVVDIVEQFGSPSYVYSRATFERHWRAFDEAFGTHPHQVCYAVKANSNLAVLNVLARLGSGFDIVSIGELERVLAAGGDANKIVFSGLGKQAHEIQRALEVGIHCFNIESTAELVAVNRIAGELGKVADISLRVNPDVDAQTHPYISTGLKENKFGIDIDIALETYVAASRMDNVSIVGVDCHIGSQLTSVKPFVDALDRVLKLVDALVEEGIKLKHLDLGGGLGVNYDDETPPEPSEYAQALVEKISARDEYKHLALYMEPGRAIAANAGIFVTKIEYLKPTAYKNFAVIDGAMNDLIRPSLYGAWQSIVPVVLRSAATTEEKVWDVVGPVCETGDFLGKDRRLAIEAGDLLAVRSAGAYGFTMSSNYNSRNRVAEIMVDGDHAYVVRRRETIEDQIAHESLLP